MDKNTEREIAKGLRQGNRQAWLQLYDAHAEQVWKNVARLVGGDSTTVADLVQESRRKITEWRPGAEWQEDKNWLDGVEPDKIRNGSITVHDTTEVIQAPNGHWYPKVIVEKQSGIRKDYKEAELKVRTVKRIYLRTDPEFPEYIFNADKFPGQ